MSNSNNDSTKLVKPELSINKKLGNLKFDQVFDEGTIKRAERVVEQSEPLFKGETEKDFADLKKIFQDITPSNLERDAYKQLSELAFSIKSRAATGGYPLASEVANSLYKFCDGAAFLLPPDGYTALRLHYDALRQIFDKSFPTNDSLKAQKLVNGLEEISRRFLNG